MTCLLTWRYSQPAMNGLHPGSAFVIQFRMDADLVDDKLAGRIEHVVSGKTMNFQSIHDLPELLRRMLKDLWPVNQKGL
jgi:hypothetical protein